MEAPRGLRGLHARQKACSRAARRHKLWPRGLCLCPENYIKQEKVLIQTEQRSFTENHTVTPVCECISAIFDFPLFYPYLHFA